MKTYPSENSVLIRTQPLGHNYGGVLQAWALQTVLRGRGYCADTDVSSPSVPLWRIIKGVGRRVTALSAFGLGGEVLHDGAIGEIDKHLHTFMHSRMSLVKLFPKGADPDRLLLSSYTAFVAGSDQVWRPRYSDVANLLFDFIPPDSSATILSYAASFGIADSSEFTSELRQITRKLIPRFAGVSVREESGVALAAELWGRTDALHHLDPTLLVAPTGYEELIDTAPSLHGAPKPGMVVTYVLDQSNAKEVISTMAADYLSLPSESLLRPLPASMKDYRNGRQRFQKIPVESWLAGIQGAGLLVTDSFHGCVFAIIFQVPFIVVPNEGRGTERFTSLLRLLGLQWRIVDTDSELLREDLDCILSRPIDWDAVQEALRTQQANAFSYLDLYFPSLR